MEKIRLLIADDHPAFREGLCRILAEEEDLECVAKSADGIEAVKLAEELQPDVAIIDVCMPNLNGIEAAKQIKAACHNTTILMVSAFDYESYILACLQAGAVGYILKNTPLREIVSAIRLVHTGRSVLDLKVTDKIVRHLVTHRSGETDFAHLFPRELEILGLAAKGKSNKDIAGELYISERTVQTHFVNIFRKLGVNSRTQAVLHALRSGWITLNDLPHG